MENALLTRPKKEIRIWVETFEDLQSNRLGDDYFRALLKLVENGHTLAVFRHRGVTRSLTIESTADLILFKKTI